MEVGISRCGCRVCGSGPVEFAVEADTNTSDRLRVVGVNWRQRLRDPLCPPAPPSSALSSIVTWGFRMRDETRAPVHIYSTYRSSTTLVPLIELFNLSVV